MAGGNGAVVVIGASAGGVEALRAVVRELPRDFPIAVCVVLHVSPWGPSVLASILDRSGPLSASAVALPEELRAGHIYVAPPDYHLLVEDGKVQLGRGPRENGHRPAVDPLFRTAAAAHGPGVIGVVLSGTLDDGTAGLAVIKEAGGTAVVQDPTDALYPGMPRNAILNVDVDHVVPVDEIARVLVELTAPVEEGGLAMTHEPGADPLPAEETVEAWRQGEYGEASGFTCPDCGGALWEGNLGDVVQYRCHVGHVYSQESLLASGADEVESALWTAHSLLEARAALLQRLAARFREKGLRHHADRYEEDSGQLRANADTIRVAAESFRLAPGAEEAQQA